jgi:hypothetical protein
VFTEALFCDILVIFRVKCGKRLCNAFNQEERLTSFLMREGYYEEEIMAPGADRSTSTKLTLCCSLLYTEIKLQKQEQNQHVIYIRY